MYGLGCSRCPAHLSGYLAECPLKQACMNPRTGFTMVNPKWGGITTLSGILPGGGLRGDYGAYRASTLQFYRPNQAMNRGMIPLRTTPGMSGLGQTLSLTDPTTLAMLAVGGIGLFLLLRKGGGGGGTGKQIASLASKRALAGKALKEMGA